MLYTGKLALEKTHVCMLVWLVAHSAVTAVVLKRAPLNKTSGDARLNCASSVLESKHNLTLDTRVQSLNILPATEPSQHALQNVQFLLLIAV